MDINKGIISLEGALQYKRSSRAYLTVSKYIPAAGELVVATDTGEMRFGDGTNTWSNLIVRDNTKIANNLETSDTGEALDATQGKVLNDRLDTVENVNGIECGEIMFFVRIDRDETMPITDFFYYKKASLSFTASYIEQSELSYPTWSVEGLPEGLTPKTTRGVLTISGYAQEAVTKDVTITARYGECSDTKIFTFQVTKDGNAIEISNDSLGDWGIGVDSSVTLSSKITGSISGTASYYATNNPSWMSLNSSTGVLSGTATGLLTAEASPYMSSRETTEAQLNHLAIALLILCLNGVTLQST